MKKSNGTTKPVTDSKTNINLKAVESFIAILILAALGFKGVLAGLAQAPEGVKTGLALLVVLLLTKSATKH